MRVISETGYYHIILRGNGKQIVFEERADYLHFLHLMKQYSGENHVKICAFCLMQNHIHLLVCDNDRNISLFMRRLAGNYAVWFNRKYERTGHLFQGRYIARTVESDEALCIVFRYILNNPRKAGICSAADYPWSSYKAYGNPNSFVDTEVLTEFLGSFAQYAEYIGTDDDEKNDYVFTKRGHDDEWAKKVIRRSLKIENGSVLKSFDQEARNEALRTLREAGLSVRQIERLTGISKSVIQRQ